MISRKITLIGMVVFCLVLAFYMPMASANVFNVNNGSELWDALQEAAANGEDDVINLAEGTYDQYIPDPFVRFANFVCNPTELEPRSLTIQGGPGTTPDQVILDGHDNGFVLSIFDGTRADFPPPDPLPEINIIGLTIRNGDAPYKAGGLSIQSYFHHVTVRNCRIVDNTSENGRGGGARIFTRLGELIFENNLVMDNWLYERDITTDLGPATVCQGAGVQIIHQGDGAVVRNNIIANNISEGDNGTGGGLFLAGWLCGASERTWNLVNNTVVNNTARYGGGLFVDLYGILNLYNNIIYANDSPSADPGPIDFWVAEQGCDDDVYAYHNNFSRSSAMLDEDVGNVDVDPNFVGFFHLPSDSPLIDGGTDLVPSGLPETDYEGDPRTCLELPDIGADERCWAGSPRKIFKTRTKGFLRSNVRDGSEAIYQGIGVTIDNPRPAFFPGKTIHITCERSSGGLNRPSVLLVDAGDYHTVYDIPDPDTGGPATLFHFDWTVDPSIPPGDYKIFVEQPDLACGIRACLERPERACELEACHGYSRTFSIRNSDGDEDELIPEITITRPASGETYWTNEGLEINWQNSYEDPLGDYAYTRILLKNGVELDRIGPVNYAGRSLWDQINLSGYLSGSDYQVEIELYRMDLDPGPVFVTSSTSDYFNVLNYFDFTIDFGPHHPLVVYSPLGGTFRHGDALPIQWCNHPPFSDIQLRVLLVRDSTSGGGEWIISDSTWASPCGAIGDCDPDRDIDLYWTIPDTIPTGDGYRVLVEQIGGTGISLTVEPFTIE